MPENISDGRITLFLHRPLQLHNMKVTFVTTDKKSLITFLNKGTTLSAHLNGIGFAQDIAAEVNNLNQIQLLDVSHQSSTLYIQDKTSSLAPNTNNQEWLDKLDKFKVRFKPHAISLKNSSPTYLLNHTGLRILNKVL